MKTLEQVKAEYTRQTMDGRDIDRLAQFIPEDQLLNFGLSIEDKYKGTHNPIPFTRENILVQLKDDVDFGFEKALDKRGKTASLMYSVVQMWNWILEEGLEDFASYPMYGLPLFKATALKYGFDNPIGKDSGSESKYNE